MADLILPDLTYLHTFTLSHHGDCSLLGVTPAGDLFVEELYGEGGWLAQHHLSAHGMLLASIDEAEGAHTLTAPLPLPADAVRSRSGWATMWLNFAGARHRGMRALERVDDLVRPFSVQDKFRLGAHPMLNLPAPHILGLAESYVLAEANTPITGLYFVCRRARIAHVLPAPAVDDDGNPYDYDTRALYIAHFAARSAAQDESLIDQIRPMPGVTPIRPMDCAIVADRLYIADGGDPNRLSAVHVWSLDWGIDLLTPEEQLRRRIYG
jgi:hypothetical protein